MEGCAVNAVVDLGPLPFFRCLYAWRQMLIARHLLIQGSFALSETDSSISCREMGRAMVAMITVKEYLTLCAMRCE